MKMLLTLAVLLQCLVAEAAHGYYGGNVPIHSGGSDKLFGQIILACCALPVLSRLFRFGPWKGESWYETCTFAVLMPLALTLAFQIVAVAILVIPIYLAYKIYSKATKPKMPTKTTDGGSEKVSVSVSPSAIAAVEAPRAASQLQAVSRSSPQSTTPSWRTSPPQQQSAGGPIKWGWVIVFLMLLAAGISILGSGNPPPNGVQLATSAPRPHPTPPSTPSTDTLSPLSEELPPTGRNKILRREQILYCLSQEIRLSGMRAILNAGSQIELAKFDAAIADYNRRCGYFRYYARVMQAAREEVEPHREALLAEGSQTVYQWRQ